MFSPKDRCKRHPPNSQGVIKDPQTRWYFFEKLTFFDFFSFFGTNWLFMVCVTNFSDFRNLPQSCYGTKTEKSGFLIKDPPPNSREILKKTPSKPLKGGFSIGTRTCAWCPMHNLPLYLWFSVDKSSTRSPKVYFESQKPALSIEPIDRYSSHSFEHKKWQRNKNSHQNRIKIVRMLKCF